MKLKKIDWDRLTIEDFNLVDAIVERVQNEIGQDDSITPPNVMDMMMSLQLAHLSGVVNLEKLIASDNVTLLHDVLGIMFYIDIETGELKDQFLPRCA